MVDVSVIEVVLTVVVVVAVMVVVVVVVVAVMVVVVVVTPQSSYSPAACVDSTLFSPDATLRQFVTERPFPPSAAPIVCAAGVLWDPPCGKHVSLLDSLHRDGSRRQMAPAIAVLVRSHDAATPDAAITTTASGFPPFNTLQDTSSPSVAPGQALTIVLSWLIAGMQNDLIYWRNASAGRFPTWYASTTWFFKPSVSPCCGSTWHENAASRDGQLQLHIGVVDTLALLSPSMLNGNSKGRFCP